MFRRGAQARSSAVGTPDQVLVLLALAVFILVIDTTFMNVSISTLVTDLDTTVTGIQGAITFYTLVMAACMITGGKIARIWGPKRAFVVGLCIYGTGSLITSLSPNLATLVFGWSALEGVGAALVTPAVNALIVANFPKGAARAKAYGATAAIAAGGAALGPIVGGILTTYASWRLAFASEVLVVGFILLRRHRLTDLAPQAVALDRTGAALSIVGLSGIVFGILQAGTYGWVHARRPVEVFGTEVLAEGSISPALILIGAGLVVLAGLGLWERHRMRRAEEPLLDPALLRNRPVRNGTLASLLQFAVQGGAFIALPIYAQSALGFTAFETGLTLLPASLAVLLAAKVASGWGTRIAPKWIIVAGSATSIVGVVLIGVLVDTGATIWSFAPGLAVMGVGVGMALSQLTNVVVSAVDEGTAPEASGLLSTGQNLGRSLGTAISGAALVAGILAAGPALIDASTVLDSQQQSAATSALEANATFLDTSAVERAVADEPDDVQAEALRITAEAQDDAFRRALLTVALMGLIGLAFSLRLPAEKLTEARTILRQPRSSSHPRGHADGALAQVRDQS